MPNPEFYTRIKNKIDTNTNYENKNSTFLNGEMIAVTSAGNGSKYTKLKIGELNTNYNNLQFVDQEAIDLANTAQTKANAAYNLAESKVDSLSDLGITATATELNYVDGVTSAIQTQLNGKVSLTGTAAKAIADAGGNNIASTYATKTELNAIDWSDNGTSIPANSDLNNYTTLGMYYVSNEATATTLTNCPTTGNFKMYVFQRTGSSVINQLILGRSSMSLRGTNSSGTWSSWTTFASKTNIEDTYATKTELNEIKQSFQDGCDIIVDGCTTYGSTPSTNSPADIVTAIGNIATSRAEFNFKIVKGTSKPSSPTTNTIWINTSTAIGEWMIAKTAPSARRDGSALQTGDVWFVLDDFSRSVSLHLLKSNRTYVNIHTAHQWNGSSWVTKEASIYQSSKWVSIPRIYRVFPSDYACTWSNWTISSNKGTWAYSSDTMYFYGHSDGSYRRLTGLLVDFSKYSKVCIHIDENGVYSTADFRFRWRNSGGTIKVDYRISDQSSIVGTHTVDISSITEPCYLDIYFKNGGGGVVTDIWFEE